MGYRQQRKGKSRILAWLMIGIMAIGGVNIPVKNVEAETVTAVKPTGGDGSSANPYQITSEANLVWMREEVLDNNSSKLNAKLMNDITITSDNWQRIGNNVDGKRYNDTFDGDGHTIYNLKYQGQTGSNISVDAYGGLFGSISDTGVIQNLTIGTATLKGGYAAAAVVAYNSGIVLNCQVKDSIVRPETIAGGVCSQNTGKILYCSIEGTGSISSSSDNPYAGGIAGYNKGIIQYCSNAVTVTASSYAGGIAGYNEETGNISSCYSVGAVKNAKNIGGVVGYNVGIIDRLFYNKDIAKVPGSYVGVDKQVPASTTCKKFDTEDFQSGMVTYLLNGSTSGADVVWRQNIDQGMTDTYPVLDSSHNIVYQVSDDVYSNTNDDSCATGHNMTAYPAKVATCIAQGNVAYWVCNKCHRYFLDSTGTKSTTVDQVLLAKNNNHNLETHAATEATCTTAGNSLYYQCTLCGKYYKDSAATKETTLQGVTMDALGHDYKVTFKWGSGNTSAKVNIICSRNDVVKTVNCTVTSTSTEATCTKTGTTTYTAIATYDGKEFKEQKTVNGEKGSHVYGTPVFTWTKQADGSYTATAVYTCSVCNDKETMNCTVTQKDKMDATCTTKGSVAYRAAVTGKSDYEDKTFDIAATGHQLMAVSAVAATCDTPGHIAYNECSICKKKFDSGKNLLTDAEVVIKATGHTYVCKAGTDGTTHSQVCSKCGHTTGKEEHTGGTATCHSKKVCTKCGASYGEMLPHSYNDPIFTWKETADGYSVTAKMVCGVTGCAYAVEDKNCKVTYKVTKQPTCTEKGDRYYTAIATLEGKIYQDGKSADGVVDAIGHTLTHVEAKNAGKCEGDGNKEYWECTTCNKCYADAKAVNETTFEEMVIKAPGHDRNGIADNGDGTHSGKCSKCEKTYTKEKHQGGTATCASKALCTVCGAAYGSVDVNNHNYGEPEYQWNKSDDGYNVKVVLTCDRCDKDVTGHQKIYDSTAEDVIGTVLTEATCDKEGTVLYCFSKTVEGKQYTSEKKGTIAKLSHQIKQIAAKEATCTEDGNVTYYQCERCGKLFADAAGTTDITVADTVIPAEGHDRNGITDNGDGTHSGKCSKCGKVFESEEHRGGTATCVKKAQCEGCGAEYGAVDIANHDYIDPVFTWNKADDGYAVSAEFVCRNCTAETDGHTMQKECTVTETDRVDATTKAERQITYTAKVSWMGEEFNDTRIDVIPKKQDEKPDKKEETPDDKDKGSDKEDGEKKQEEDSDNKDGGNQQTNQSQANSQPANVTIINNNNTNIYVNMQVVDQSTHITYRVVTASDGTPAVSYDAPPAKDTAKVVVPSQATIDGVTYKVVAIEKNAFAKNKKLKSVTIGDNVEEIGDNAFGKCTNLKKVTIPSNVKKIGKGAFSGCKKLKKITIKTDSLTKQSIGAKAFKGIASKATIKVPKKVKKDYKKLLKKTGAGSKVKVK